MVEITLDDLLNQHRVLHRKLTGIESAIVGYGGNVPVYNSNDEDFVMPVLGNTNYPKDGTWRTKIEYFLKNKNAPMSAREITEAIQYYEKGNTAIAKIVTQYTSSLAKKGQLVVNKDNFPHMYSLKT